MMIPFARRDARLGAAAWIGKYTIITLVFFGLVSGVSSKGIWKKPRATLVSFVTNDKVPLLASTVEDLEARFNAAHRYDWALFSPEPLVLEHKELLSNLTSAAVTFNVVADKYWADWNLPTDRCQAPRTPA